MKTSTNLLVITVALLFSACGQQANTEGTSAAGSETGNATATTETGNDQKLIATINSNKIYMSDFEKFAARRIAQDPQLQQAPQILLNELINRELLIQTAEAEGIDKREEIVDQIKNERDSIVLATLLDEKLEGTDLSDEALQAEYNEQLKAVSSKEYQASHILVAEKTTAEGLITQLQSGGDFATLARENSTGPTKDNGGDLGWVRPETMAAEFSNALTNLSVGSYTQAPIETRFGWHVIRLNDTRDLTPPTFEESKERLKSILANKAAQVYLTGVRESSKVDIYDPETGEVISQAAVAANPETDTTAN